MSLVYLNGDFLPANEASISPMDRGFLFADGVYEVIPVYKGKLFRLTAHLERLERSLDATLIKRPHSQSEWKNILEHLVEKNGSGNLTIYLQITRGVVEKRDHVYPRENLEPTIFITTSPFENAFLDIDTVKGAKAITKEDIRWKRCDIKSVSLLPNIMMRQEAAEQGAVEALLLNDGLAVEGAASNLFIVKDGTIITPPKGHELLGGITRDLVLELAEQERIQTQEAPISKEALFSADEVWITSSTKEIFPIVQIDEVLLSNSQPGPIWYKMITAYQNHKKRLLAGEISE